MKQLTFLPEFLELIKSGQKTQTRRPIKPQPENCPYCHNQGLREVSKLLTGAPVRVRCEFCHTHKSVFAYTTLNLPCQYGEIGDMVNVNNDALLEITDIRVEKLCTISYANLTEEGFGALKLPLTRFILLWDSIYKASGYGWDENPWVWVIEFRRVEE